MLLLKFLKEIKKKNDDDDQRLEGMLSKYSAYHHVIIRTWFIPSTHAKAGYSGTFL